MDITRFTDEQLDEIVEWLEVEDRPTAYPVPGAIRYLRSQLDRGREVLRMASGSGELIVEIAALRDQLDRAREALRRVHHGEQPDGKCTYWRCRIIDETLAALDGHHGEPK
jgi:hypothetical protein